jgi:hypothetical protein
MLNRATGVFTRLATYALLNASKKKKKKKKKKKNYIQSLKSACG